MATPVIVFDVNETLSDLSPMAQYFAEVGVPEELAGSWFAGVLRDGFGLAAAGANERFSVIADATLRSILAGRRLNRSIDDAVAHLLGCLQALPVHQDVPDAVGRLAHAGHRLVALTNGATATADSLLKRGGVREHFELLLSVEDAPLWKPAPASYAYAAVRCGTAPADMLLVAVHPWDIDGAARAGLQTAWINRSGVPYPTYATPPTYTTDGLAALADQLTR
ncbi:haloacid dehalogenase type II [Arthrobacter sp. HLT1-21]